MARIRTIKPEFWTSEQTAAVSRDARLLFIGLWSFSDDGGVHPASPMRVKMEILPGDNVEIRDVEAWIEELITADLLLEFKSGDKVYWKITGWKKHQRIESPTYRHPQPDNSTTIRRDIVDTSANTRRDLDDSSPPEGKGREGSLKEEENNTTYCSPETEQVPPSEDENDEVFLIFDTVGKGPKTWTLTSGKVAEYREDFPGLDVEAECRKALAWVKADPHRRKTAGRGMLRFLTGWLTRATNNGGAARGSPQPARREQMDLSEIDLD